MADQEPTTGEMPAEQPKSESAAVSVEEFEKVKKALADANKEAAARRKQLEAYEKVEADKKAAEMTELQKLTAELEQTRAKAAEFERKELQRKAAAEVGLPEQLAYRLVGADLEAMTEDAKALAESLKLTTKQQPPKLPPNNPGDGKKGETREQTRARLLGNQSVVFDPTLAKERGGGVVWNSKD